MEENTTVSLLKRLRWERLALLVSPLLVIVIVVVILLQQAGLFSSNNGPYQHFVLQPHWRQVKVFSGSGNKILFNQDLPLNTAWGVALTCSGSASASLEFTVQGAPTRSAPLPCNAANADKVSSPTVNLGLEAGQNVMQQMAVRIAPAVSWTLQLVTGPTALQPGPDMIVQKKLSGTGSFNGAPSLSFTSKWSILYTCSNPGGTFTVSLNGVDEPYITCNGSTGQINYPKKVKPAIKQVSITAPANAYWEVVFVMSK